MQVVSATDCGIAASDSPTPASDDGPLRPARRPAAPVVVTLLIAIVMPLVMPKEFSPGRGFAVAGVEAILLVA